MERIKKPFRVFLLAIILATSVSALGQNSGKRSLTRADYKLWSTMDGLQISDYGNWISYELNYESGDDTLFAKNAKTRALLSYPKSRSGRFAGDAGFACIDSQNNLLLTDLKSGRIVPIPHVIEFDIGNDGKQFLSVEEAGEYRNLCVRSMDGRLSRQIENVQEYKVNCQKNMVAVGYLKDKRYRMAIMRLEGKFEATEVEGVALKATSFKWSDNDAYLGFFVHVKDDMLWLAHYAVNKRELKWLKGFSAPNLVDKAMVESSDTPMIVTDDGRTVFFGIHQAQFSVTEKPIVEVWNGNDKALHEELAAIASYNKPYLAVWHTDRNEVIQINNANNSALLLSMNYAYAITGDVFQYAPGYKDYCQYDINYKNIDDGTMSLLAKRFYGQPMNIGTSEDGKYLHYYQDGNWWVYNSALKSTTNITYSIGVEWDNHDVDPGNAQVVYGVAGWSHDGKSIFIYDRFDLWKISADGSQTTNLTNGRSSNKRYRLSTAPKFPQQRFNFSANPVGTIDLWDDLVFSVYNFRTAASGLSMRHLNGKIEVLEYDDAAFLNFQKAKKSDVFIYTKQSFSQPPEIIWKEAKKKGKSIVATNPQQRKFLWGKSEMIYYTDSRGNDLNSVLFYPADYQQGKKYPMVVHIYERLSDLANRYENPSEHNGAGFNVTTLTTNGYFVLMPDIVYSKGNPGFSAVDCVTSAVKQVLQGGQIDSKKIGLQGHSFGGYETNFILTQTNIFASAISGSGVSDPQRIYFSIMDNAMKPEIWRYENQQFRFGGSFYEIQDSYLKNSPILHAQNITTPLLIWSGKDDLNVRTEQSIAFYIALRRLNKSFMMLLYPNETHVMVGNAATKNIHDRFLDWFGYYLKGEPCNWIFEGTK